jgi:DNA-binding transcriptional MerR regulator
MAMPKREVFKAPEVCEMAQLQPYVLRTWEAEFPALGQPSNGGPRLYRRADVEMVLRIKQLVFVEGLTLAGARRRLEEQEAGPSIAAVAVDDVLGGMARSRLRQVRTGLEAIMKLLEKDVGERELQLVPPPAAKPRTLAARRSSKPAMKGTSGKRRRAS